MKEENFEEPKKTIQNSEIIHISNKENYLNQINNLNNETFNQINFTSSSYNENRTKDTLYGNNYLNYYLNNNYSSSKNCCNSKIKKMGNLPVYFFVNEQPLIVLGCKNKSLIIIYEIILQLSFIILMTTISKVIPSLMNILLSFLYINCFFCHAFIYLINPGIPNIEHYSKIFLKSEQYMKMGEQQKRNCYLCEKCNIVINFNEDIEHCEECDICVIKFDHHCFWTGKCITKKNIWAFYFFSFGTMVYILWYFVIIIYWLITQVGQS